MLILSWLIVKKCRIIKRINNKICKRNAEIWCYQAVFAFLFCKDFWLCNVERMSYGVPRCTRGVDYRVFSVITIRKTLCGLSKVERSGAVVAQCELNFHDLSASAQLFA